MINWLDILVILVLFLFALEGIGRNFFLELLDFLSFLLAFFLSLRFYNLASNFYEGGFKISHSISTVLGFMTVWFLVESVFFALVHAFVFKKITLWHQNYPVLNKFAPIPAFLRGLVFVAIILVLIGTFPIQPQIKAGVKNSKIGSFILSKAHQLENPLKSVFGGITQDSLTFLTIKPKSGESVNLGFQTSEFFPNPALEDRMITLVNNERKKVGLNSLSFEPELRFLARSHSADMFLRGYFSHYSPEGKNVADRATGQNIKYMVIGENLAYAPSLELAHNGLMNSPGHRANILSADFNKIGIGIMDGGVYGLMVTQVFSD